MNTSGLFCHLHPLVFLCSRENVATTGDMVADDLTSVTFTNKSLGAVRKHRHIFFPDKLWWKPRRHNWSSPAACLGVCVRHLFSVSVSILSLCVSCNAHLQAGGVICVHVNPLRPVCQSIWEQGLDCLIACFTRWLPLHYYRSSLIVVPKLFCQL